MAWFHVIMSAEGAVRRLRIYVDTSVLGAMFDDEFREPTEAFFRESENARFDIVVSSLLEDEIAEAPLVVRRS